MQQVAPQPVLMNFTFAAKKRKKNSSAVQPQKQQQPVVDAGRNPQKSDLNPMPHAKAASQKSHKSQKHPVKEAKTNESPRAEKRKRDGESNGGAAAAKKPTLPTADEIGAADDSANGQDSGSSSRAKRFTLFVGNMPFTANEAEVRQHFSNCGVVSCRLLRNKGSAAGKGIAFLDVSDSKGYIAALKLHHSLMGGRAINVEPTAGGGGNSVQRKGKIELKKKRLEKVIKAGATDPRAGAPKGGAGDSHGKNRQRRQDSSK